MNLKAAFVRYVRDLTGRDVGITALPGDRQSKLPLYLRSYYDLVRAGLFDRPTILALQKSEMESATPAEYGRHLKVLQSTLGGDLVLVIPEMASYLRRELLRMGIPFVVPGRQMFLPSLLVDLRERFPVRDRTVKPLSAASQVILLRHLQGYPVEGVALRQLADEIGYSAMTLSNVKGELEAAGLCKVAQKGRHTVIAFSEDKKTLWTKAGSLLRSPVKARHWIRWQQPAKDAVKAGLSALTKRSMIADDPIPTYAMKDSAYRVHLENGRITGCPGAEAAAAKIECWRYDPRLVTANDQVDPLSLYLSLRRDADDERIAQARDQMLKALPW